MESGQLWRQLDSRLHFGKRCFVFTHSSLHFILTGLTWSELWRRGWNSFDTIASHVLLKFFGIFFQSLRFTFVREWMPWILQQYSFQSVEFFQLQRFDIALLPTRLSIGKGSYWTHVSPILIVPFGKLWDSSKPCFKSYIVSNTADKKALDIGVISVEDSVWVVELKELHQDRAPSCYILCWLMHHWES